MYAHPRDGSETVRYNTEVVHITARGRLRPWGGSGLQQAAGGGRGLDEPSGGGCE